MKNKIIKVRKLGNKRDLSKLTEGNVVMISVGSGAINDFREYHGPAIFIGRANNGLNFCRPQANTQNTSVGYHLYRKDISVTSNGIISARDFFTYGCKQTELTKNSGLI